MHRTIHSVNQLSIYGAVASWCEKFGLKLDEKLPKKKNVFLFVYIYIHILQGIQPKEVTSVVMAPRNEEPAAGNSLREVQQNVETLKTEVQFTRVRKEATFIHKVAVGRYYRTGGDVGDGFGDRTSASREYTGPLLDSDSTIFAA